MKAIDVHSHWGTEKGYLYKGAEAIVAAEKNYRMKVVYRTSKEMAEDLRAADVKTILDYGFTMEMPIEEARELPVVIPELFYSFKDKYNPRDQAIAFILTKARTDENIPYSELNILNPPL